MYSLGMSCSQGIQGCFASFARSAPVPEVLTAGGSRRWRDGLVETAQPSASLYKQCMSMVAAIARWGC